jgi:hypothetical protein
MNGGGGGFILCAQLSYIWANKVSGLKNIHVPVQAIKVRRGMASKLPNLGIRSRCVDNITLWPLCVPTPQKKECLVAIEYVAGSVPSASLNILEMR